MPLPRYYPWRFSLRTALIATTLLCVWLAWHIPATRRQRQAVETIRAAGGWVAYDYAWEGDEWVKGGRSWVPERLRKAFGEDAFHSVEAVHISALFHSAYDQGRSYTGHDPEATVPPEVWQAVAALRSTKWLALNARNISDDELRHLSGLYRLQHLKMEGVPIEGSGLEHLVGLRNLKHLNLSRIHLKDEHAHYLASMQQLRILGLNDSTISPTVAADLQRKMPRCKQYYEHWPAEPGPASPWIGIRLGLPTPVENGSNE